MPFFASIEANFSYGRQPQTIPSFGPAPSYYTTSSGFFMNQPGYQANSLQLKASSNISTATAIRTYTTFNTNAWTNIHDKDLDSNVWYGMPEGSRILYKYWLTKGGTTISTNNLGTYTGATTSVLGACYAPAVMWGTTSSYGAFIIGGFSQSVVHVLEFNPTKSGWSFSYTVPYTSEVYGTEVVPKAASGFTNDYGVAYTRGTKQMSSWTVNMSTRSWTNRKDNSYVGGTTGPSNGCGMIYYPPGKPIFANDPDTSTNRIAMNDTSSARLYVWTITESGTQLNWTYLKGVTTSENASYPYHMSINTYNAIA